MLRAARWKCRTPKIAKKSPSAHHRTTLSGYVFATKARIDNRKKNFLNSSISPIRPHNMVNFGLLTAEIGSGVWGTPANFNGFLVLAALLHSTLYWASAKLCGVEQRAPPIYSAGRPSRRALAHISIFWLFDEVFVTSLPAGMRSIAMSVSVCRYVPCPLAYLYKNSAIAEMGDRPRAKWAKSGGLLCPFPWGAVSPSNTMSPAGPRLYLRTKWYPDPCSSLATLDMGRKDGAAVPLSVRKLG